MIHFLCPHCRHTIALQLVEGEDCPINAPDPVEGLLELPVLPKRECQVLSLLCQGLTIRQVAARLGLHPRTVGVHIRRLKERFGAENIPHLIRLCRLPG
jgi:DNA-binding CsgD family transcriptional regulator